MTTTPTAKRTKFFKPHLRIRWLLACRKEVLVTVWRNDLIQNILGIFYSLYSIQIILGIQNILGVKSFWFGADMKSNPMCRVIWSNIWIIYLTISPCSFVSSLAIVINCTWTRHIPILLIYILRSNRDQLRKMKLQGLNQRRGINSQPEALGLHFSQLVPVGF